MALLPEDELYLILCEVIDIQRERSSHLNRAHRHDENNNTFLAANALGDYHSSAALLKQLRARSDELVKKLSSETVEKICLQAKQAKRHRALYWGDEVSYTPL
jgi:hypothetical protein